MLLVRSGAVAVVAVDVATAIVISLIATYHVC